MIQDDRRVPLHRVKKQTRALRKDIIGFTRDLIAIPTENPPGRNYRECVRLVSSLLEQFGLKSRILKVGGYTDLTHPRYCILSSWGSGKRKLYFHAHYDVVPGTNISHFRPYVRRSRLYGRGAADMKAGLAAMVYALRVLQQLEVDLDGQIQLVIVPDEETGGRAGTGYLFERGYIEKENSIGMLMPEPTSGAIWNACRGAISLRVRITGKPVHVVLQKEGINAFEQMVTLSNTLIKYKRRVEKRKTDCSVLPGESRNSIVMLGGTCECGTNFNVVPGSCSFSIERRLNPEENFTEEKKHLLGIFSRFRRSGMKIDVEFLQEGESASAPTGHELAHVLAGSINDVRGKQPAFIMCPGLLEIRYYLKKGIPAYACGPGSLNRAHHPDEFVEIERVIDCATIYALTALRLLSRRE
jgi:succinyl-diaminopimelate desuccinylase